MASFDHFLKKIADLWSILGTYCQACIFKSSFKLAKKCIVCIKRDIFKIANFVFNFIRAWGVTKCTSYCHLVYLLLGN